MRLADGARRALESRHLPPWLALIAVGLCLPALRIGLVADDYMHCTALSRPAGLAIVHRSPMDLFAFIDGDPRRNLRLMDMGLLPWWSLPSLHISFFRPVAGLTHWLDARLWVDRPWLMHAQSLAWLAAAVAAAAALFRRVTGAAWVGGLAGLLFALDDAHGWPACWVANRNAMVGLVFGLLALLAHDRWRREGRRASAALAPACFLLGLLGNEATIAVVGYLIAYAMFLEPTRDRRRYLTLLPCAVVAVAWHSVYHALGYGAEGSAVYIHPADSPLLFARELIRRLPFLFWGQWSFPPADVAIVLSQAASRIGLWIAAGFMLLMGVVLWPLVRRDAAARFWALGMAIALVPCCTTMPANRLLMFVGIGGSGLLAQLLAAAWGATDAPFDRRGELARQPSAGWRRLARIVTVPMILIHFVVSPIALALAPRSLGQLGALLDRSVASLPCEAGIERRQILIANSPFALFSGASPVFQAVLGRPWAARTMVLAGGIYSIQFERRDERTLLVRPEGGFLAPHGMSRPADADGGPAVELLFFSQLLDRLFRDDAHPFRAGERLELTGLTIEVTRLTPDGQPAEAAFRFDRPLEDSSLHWVQWKNGLYAPFTPPRVGETVTLPPVEVSL